MDVSRLDSHQYLLNYRLNTNFFFLIEQLRGWTGSYFQQGNTSSLGTLKPLSDS